MREGETTVRSVPINTKAYIRKANVLEDVIAYLNKSAEADLISRLYDGIANAELPSHQVQVWLTPEERALVDGIIRGAELDR
jgi:hypothetical protein